MTGPKHITHYIGKTKVGKIALRESEIQAQILKFLERHPDVAWCKRMNVGGAKLKGRQVQFAFKGCSDIIGQMSPSKGGVFLAIEVKTDTGKATTEQLQFIEQVKRNGGIAGITRSLEDVIEIIRNAEKETVHP